MIVHNKSTTTEARVQLQTTFLFSLIQVHLRPICCRLSARSFVPIATYRCETFFPLLWCTRDFSSYPKTHHSFSVLHPYISLTTTLVSTHFLRSVRLPHRKRHYTADPLLQQFRSSLIHDRCSVFYNSLLSPFSYIHSIPSPLTHSLTHSLTRCLIHSLIIHTTSIGS